MKSIKVDYYNHNPHLFDYPIESLSSLSGRCAYILNGDAAFDSCILHLKKKGIEVKRYKDIEEISDDVCPEIAIVFPPKNIIGIDADSRGEYYRILYHYIKFAQMMVLKMSEQSSVFHHLIFVYPSGADRYSCKLQNMAYYALTGLTAGLGKIYAPKSTIINGLIIGETTEDSQLIEWIEYLVSNNSNNLIGQNIKL